MCRGYDLYQVYDVYWVRHVYRVFDACTGGPTCVPGVRSVYLVSDVCIGSWMCVGSTRIRQVYKSLTCQSGGSTYVPGSLTCVPGGSTTESDMYRWSGVSTGNVMYVPVF